MRKLASVVTIDQLLPIEGADKIEVATMNGKGWKVVVAKGEFHPGDMALYYEIDSFLPPNDERYAFLKDRCLRRFVSKSGQVLREGIKIKTIKLRGQVSQGLLIPLDKFVGPDKEIQCVDEPATPENCEAEDGRPLTAEELAGMKVSTLTAKLVHEGTADTEAWVEKIEVTEGTDLTELLKVEHYDEVKEQLTPMTGGGALSADAMSKFPSDYAPKTDEERIQNLGDWFGKYADRKWEVTCKDDGSSCSMFYSPTVDAENPFGVCSRNNRLKPVTAAGVVPGMWLLAKKYLVEEKLKALFEKEGKEWMLQGEMVAPGLQKNRDKYLEPEWHVFRIWDIKEQKFVEPSVRRQFCKDNGIPHVAVIAEEMPVFQVHTTCDDLLKFAEGKTARGNEREGLVFKTSDGIEPQLSFKAVSNKYLLKQED